MNITRIFIARLPTLSLPDPAVPGGPPAEAAEAGQPADRQGCPECRGGASQRRAGQGAAGADQADGVHGGPKGGGHTVGEGWERRVISSFDMDGLPN